MNNRHVVRDAAISVPIKADGLNIQFEITAEMLLMAESALPKLVDVPRGLDLPNLFPLKPHISLEESNHYEMTDKFRKFSKPKTITFNKKFSTTFTIYLICHYQISKANSKLKNYNSTLIPN